MILSQCEETEGRRPYYSPHRDIHPHDVIYAQPVTIKPVGHPLPAIPVKRPYGSAKPVPLLPSFGSSLPGPVYSGPTFSRPPSSFVGPYPGYKKIGSPPFISKPIYEGPGIGLDYEDKLIDKKQVVLQSGPSAVQQHVHHHYHHADATVASGSAVGIAPKPVVIPSPSLGIGNGLGSYGYGNSGTYGGPYNDFEDYKKAFKIKTTTSNGGPSVMSPEKSYAEKYPAYVKQHGKQFAGGFDDGYQFGGDSNFGSSSLNYAEDADCTCVPYDQCATINHVGRKDDLYLAIDPRNLDKDIEAEAETVEVVITDGNGTMSVVRVPKGVNETELIEQTKNESAKGAAAAATFKTEVAKRNRREVKQITKDDKKQEAQEVS